MKLTQAMKTILEANANNFELDYLESDAVLETSMNALSHYKYNREKFKNYYISYISLYKGYYFELNNTSDNITDENLKHLKYLEKILDNY